jgi:hypothetical protein
MITLRFVSPASPPPGATLPALNASFRRTLRAEDKSERTVKSYTEAVGLLADFLAARGHPLTVNAVKRADVRDFIADQLPGLWRVRGWVILRRARLEIMLPRR